MLALISDFQTLAHANWDFLQLEIHLWSTEKNNFCLLHTRYNLQEKLNLQMHSLKPMSYAY